ncbi:MAG: hypothetical protein PHP00_11975 [Thiotrichaceae bacterium]|nr:hypothetical protein [Thiotrichaceae bacterium]
MENSNNPYTPPTSTTHENLLTQRDRDILTRYLHFHGKKPTIWQVLKPQKKTITAFFMTICVLVIGAAFLIYALANTKIYSFFWGYTIGFLMACIIYYVIFNYQIIKQFCDFWKVQDQVLDFDKIKKLLNNEPVD